MPEKAPSIGDELANGRDVLVGNAVVTADQRSIEIRNEKVSVKLAHFFSENFGYSASSLPPVSLKKIISETMVVKVRIDDSAAAVP